MPQFVSLIKGLVPVTFPPVCRAPNHAPYQINSLDCLVSSEHHAAQSYFDDATKREFLHLCWSVDQSKDDDLSEYDFMFDWYLECCSQASRKLEELECTHRHICEAVIGMSKDTRQVCEDSLKNNLPSNMDSIVVKECMQFAARSILFIDVTNWQSDESLVTFVSRTIATESREPDDFRFPASFNAKTFDNVAGITVQWTRIINAHLEITGYDSHLSIFHSPTILRLYEDCDMGKIFPDGFLAELRRTACLMLPTSNTSVRRWYQKQRKWQLEPGEGTSFFLRASERNTRNFNFCKDRLIVAKEVFDAHQPSGLLQFWRDNRNPVQYWTFWVAIVVFVLTIVACIEGALQVYKAYYPS